MTEEPRSTLSQESGFDHYFVKPVSLEKLTELFIPTQPVLDAPDLTDATPNETGGESHGDI